MRQTRDDEKDSLSPRRPVVRVKVETPKNPSKRTAMNEEQPEDPQVADETSRYQETLIALKKDLMAALPKKESPNPIFQAVKLALLKACAGNNIHDILAAAQPLYETPEKNLRDVKDSVTRVFEAFDDLKIRKLVTYFVAQSKALIATKWDYDDVEYAVVKQMQQLELQKELDAHNQQIYDELARIEKQRADVCARLVEHEDEIDDSQKEDRKLEYPINGDPLLNTPLYDLNKLTHVLSPRSMKLITILQQGKISGRPDLNQSIENICFAICMNYKDQSRHRLKALWNELSTEALVRNFDAEVHHILESQQREDDVVKLLSSKPQVDRLKKLFILITLYYPKQPRVIPGEGSLFDYKLDYVTQIIEEMVKEKEDVNSVLEYFEGSILKHLHDIIPAELDRIVRYFKTVEQAVPLNPKSTYFTETQYCRLFTEFRDRVMRIAKIYSADTYDHCANTHEQAKILLSHCQSSIEAGQKKVDAKYVKTVVNDHDLLDLYTLVRSAAEESNKDYVREVSVWSRLFGATEIDNPFAKQLEACLESCITVNRILLAWYEDEQTYQNIQKVRTNLKQTKHTNHHLIKENAEKLREAEAQNNEVSFRIDAIDSEIREMTFSRSSAFNISFAVNQPPASQPVLPSQPHSSKPALPPAQPVPRHVGNMHGLMSNGKNDKEQDLVKLSQAICKRRHAIIAAAFNRTPIDPKFHSIRDEICFEFCANYADQSKAKTLEIIDKVRAANPALFAEFAQTTAHKALVWACAKDDAAWDVAPEKLKTQPVRYLASLLLFYVPCKATIFTTTNERIAFFIADIARRLEKSPEFVIDNQSAIVKTSLNPIRADLLQIIAAKYPQAEAPAPDSPGKK